MEHFLVVVPKAGEPFQVTLHDGETRLGRCGHNDLILHDNTISRRHAVITAQNDGNYLCDLGSRCQTYLNGRTVGRPTMLQAGDQIRMGNTMLVYDGAPVAPAAIQENLLPAVTENIVSSGNNWLTPTPARPQTVLSTSESTEDQDSASRYIRLFLRADKALDIHLTPDELWIRALDLVRQEVPFERGVVLTPEIGGLVSRATWVPEEQAGKTVHVSQAITDRVMETGESLLVCDGLDFSNYRQRDSISTSRIRSLMCAPLLADEKFLGLIYVDTAVDRGPFTADSLHVLTHLASLTASRIESRRLLERSREADDLAAELDQAAKIQSRLLPGKPPEVSGYSIHGISEPCRCVGGDHLDYFPLGDGRLALALGDVAGKGLPAAFIMCSLHSSLRALARSLACPAATMTALSRLMFHDLPDNRFVTLFYGILDPAANTLTYVNAGHCPPLLIHADRKIEELEVSGLPAGIINEVEYTYDKVKLHPGDHLVSFSDGVPEASNATGEFYGNQRIREALERHHLLPPAGLVEALLEDMETFHGATPQEDDITVMSLQRLA